MNAGGLTRRPIRVVVADDSAISRAALRALLEAEADIEVCAEARDGHEALTEVLTKRPDLVTVDLEMPGMRGLELIQHIMSEAPLPVLVVTAQADGPAGDVAFQAISRGALDLAMKSELRGSDGGRSFRHRVRRLAAVPVVRHIAHPLKRAGSRVRPPGQAPLVVGIAASAGGPASLAALLPAIGPGSKLCVLIVQHISSSFDAAFLRFLQQGARVPVQFVDRPTRISPATIHVAPADRHLVVVDRDLISLSDAPPVDGFRPSATVLFDSLAEQQGPGALGIVLSGIGRDGASGLAALRARGGTTIAQTAESAAVNGMPQAARDRGAAMHCLDLSQIAAQLADLGAG